MRYGLIGQHLAHSFSAQIHGMIGAYEYALSEIAPDRLQDFMLRRDFLGINVTIPYKQAVLPYLDHVDDAAAAIGAVNTVVNTGGKLYGYNTDYGGLLALLRRRQMDLSGKKVLILGTGGTRRTARAVARELGAAEVRTVSRSEKPGAITYLQAAAHHADADFIINTTPCGMSPHLDDSPADLASFTRLRGLIDVIYHPLSTNLVLEARQRDIPSAGGLYMLVAQAVLASQLFTGKIYSADLTDRIYARLLYEKRNLVLIGMPGCGKTTVGQAVARLLQRPLMDLDRQITGSTGRSVQEIFADEGEKTFRRMETTAIRALAGQTGQVIATGGGSILSAENVRLLRQNGLLIFLDRPLDCLLPTADRPLADTAGKMRKIFEKRLPLYREAADCTVPVTGHIPDIAHEVVRCFKEACWL